MVKNRLENVFKRSTAHRDSIVRALGHISVNTICRASILYFTDTCVCPHFVVWVRVRTKKGSYKNNNKKNIINERKEKWTNVSIHKPDEELPRAPHRTSMSNMFLRWLITWHTRSLTHTYREEGTDIKAEKKRTSFVRMPTHHSQSVRDKGSALFTDTFFAPHIHLIYQQCTALKPIRSS